MEERWSAPTLNRSRQEPNGAGRGHNLGPHPEQIQSLCLHRQG
jgi:hypothetical protein